MLLPIISACVSCGPSVSTVMPFRLSYICMSSTLPFDDCAFPFNVVSTVVVCKGKLRSCEEGWMGPLSGH